MKESAFPNVPMQLTEAVGNFIEPLRTERLRYIAAATLVAVEYLRKDMIGPTAPSHTNFEPDSEGRVSWEKSVRIHMLGVSLFTLRNEPGFAEVCRRLGNQELRAAYYEAYAASAFVNCGYSIEMRRETGARGEDFDFRALHASGAVNVEVTALEAPTFSEKTVTNALQQKRKQLPDTAPGVIFCMYPEAWAGQVQISSELHGISADFLRGTRRINHIIYLREQRVPIDGTDGALVLTGSYATHPNPRHPSQFLIDAIASNDLGLGLDANHREFHQWVDWALERQ